MGPDLEATVQEYHRALGGVIRGDSTLQERLWSRRDDATLANPLGPPARGWDGVSDALRRAVARLSDGEVLGFERISSYASDELAYILEIERYRMKVGDTPEAMPSSLRVTTIFRREEDGWKIVHRHADPITTPRPAESVVED
jgi:ketosteroid isomerase-like protein